MPALEWYVFLFSLNLQFQQTEVLPIEIIIPGDETVSANQTKTTAETIPVDQTKTPAEAILADQAKTPDKTIPADQTMGPTDDPARKKRRGMFVGTIFVFFLGIYI